MSLYLHPGEGWKGHARHGAAQPQNRMQHAVCMVCTVYASVLLQPHHMLLTTRLTP
jgi:hypothetical protein